MERLGILDGFVHLKLSAKNTSSASTTPSMYPFPKYVIKILENEYKHLKLTMQKSISGYNFMEFML